MSRTFAGLMIVAALASPVMACAASGKTEETLSVSIASIQTVSAADQPGRLKEFTVTLQPAGGGEVQRFTVQGPDELIASDEQPRAEVVGERLLVFTHSVIAVFDLTSRRQVIDLVAAPEVVASAEGRRVAFKTLQLPFTPTEASSSVIQVLDVPSLDVEPVFPERSTIAPSQFGHLLAWVEDPAARHSAGKLFFSPDGSQLVFFCTHNQGVGAAGAPQQVYLVVVDLSQGLAKSRFVHRAFDWEAHLRSGVTLGDRKPFFAAETVAWRGDGTLVVKPPHYASWLENEIVLPLPGPGDWPAGTSDPEEGS